MPDNITLAQQAINAANEALRNPRDGTYENATVVALIGIGNALVAIAEELQTVQGYMRDDRSGAIQPRRMTKPT